MATTENLRSESRMVQTEAGGEMTTRAALLLWAAVEIERLQRIAWECWRRDIMSKAEAEKVIGVPSIIWPDDKATEATEGE